LFLYMSMKGYIVGFSARTASRSIVTLVVIVVIFLSSDLIMAGVAYASQWLIAPFSQGWPDWVTLGLRWLLCSLLITVGGYLIGRGIILTCRRTEAATAPPTDTTDRRLHWSRLALERGLYVLASLIAGAPGIAWWYAPRHDPHLQARVWGAAAILGFTMSAFYLGLFDARYRWWSIGGFVALILILVLLPALRPKRKVDLDVT
jgi:hypothetical protein